MNTKLLVAAMVIAGLATGSTLTADAKTTKKHHKTSSMTTGMGGANRGNAANPSGQGNVGPGTNNNTGPSSGGR